MTDDDESSPLIQPEFIERVKIADDLFEDEFMEWVEADKNEPTEETLTDEHIINKVLNPTMPMDEVSDKEDEVDTSTSCTVTWKQAAVLLRTFMEFAGKNDQYSAGVRSLFYERRSRSVKQADIRDFFRKS